MNDDLWDLRRSPELDEDAAAAILPLSVPPIDAFEPRAVGTAGVRPARAWNAGAWFGSLFGCTAWLLLLGVVLLARDATAAGTAIAAFAMTNVAGLALWRRRATWSFFAAMETLLLVLTIATATTVTVVNLRGVADPPRQGVLVSTWMPWWVIAFPPALMVWYFLFGKRMRPTTASGR